MDVPAEDAEDDPWAARRERIGAAFDQLAGALRQVAVGARSARLDAGEARSAFQSLGRVAQQRADEVGACGAHVTTTVLPHLRAGREIARLLSSGIDGCEEVAAWHDATVAALSTFDTVPGTADGVVERSRAVQTSCAEAAATATGMVAVLEVLTEVAPAHAATLAQVGAVSLYHRARPVLERTDRWLAERSAELPRSTDVEPLRPQLPAAAFADRSGPYVVLVAALTSLDNAFTRWRTAYQEFLGELGSADLTAEDWPAHFGGRAR